MKLIIINGPPGVGKTTLAKKLWEIMPMSFLLDLDEQRAPISHYREHRKESSILSFDIALAIAEACFKRGNNFISDKGMLDLIEGGREKNVLDLFIELGKKYNTEIYEIMLWANQQTVIDRANKRGYENKIWSSPETIADEWEKMNIFKDKRKDEIVIETDNLTPDEVFEKVSKMVGISDK